MVWLDGDEEPFRRETSADLSAWPRSRHRLSAGGGVSLHLLLFGVDVETGEQESVRTVAAEVSQGRPRAHVLTVRDVIDYGRVPGSPSSTS